MIPRKNRSVKAARPQSVGLDQTATTSKPPKTAADLKPFPKKYRHLEPLLSTVPASDVIQTIAGCAQVGFNDDAIAAALRTLGAHYQQAEHRCSTCLAWGQSDGALYAGYVDSVNH